MPSRESALRLMCQLRGSRTLLASKTAEQLWVFRQPGATGFDRHILESYTCWLERPLPTARPRFC